MAGAQGARKGGADGVGLFRTLVFFLRRDVISVSFCLSVALVFLALLYSKDIFSPGISAVSLFIFPISWNNATGLVALAAGICSAANFAQERTTRYARYILARIPRRRYLIARFAAICLSTGCALFAAFLLFGLFCFFESGGILLPSDFSQVEVQTMSPLLTGGFPVLWFLPILAVQFMFGIALGGLGACATAFVPNRFIAYSAPFIIFFVWAQICSWAGLPAWANPLNLSKYTFQTASMAATFALYVATYLGVTLLFFSVFYYKGNKEVRHDN